MDPRFHPHNTHLEQHEVFSSVDPYLRRLADYPLVHHSSLLKRLPDSPGIFTITGGRQVGKTTLLKQWMSTLLSRNIPSHSILFLTGEIIDDHHSLVRIVTELAEEYDRLKYLLIDEITYIRDWDKGIKYLADAGFLDQVTLVLTGSDSVIIQEARSRFPGRRGEEDIVDFHIYPLNLYETVRLKKRFTSDELNMLSTNPKPPVPLVERLFTEFDEYLVHGGFLTAMNNMAEHGRILPATFYTYSDWIRGDILKRRKQEHYLREIVNGIIKRYGSQVTWNNMLADLSIDHPQTVSDYMNLLVSMDAVFIQHALREDKLTAAPKKAKKILFTDPFIYHALFAWIHQDKDPFLHQVKQLSSQKERYARIVESCAVAHCRRHFPTYYIKARGEVDIAYVENKRFLPVEVKWTGQLRPGELAQVKKYSNSRIWAKSFKHNELDGVPVDPLPLALFRLDAE